MAIIINSPNNPTGDVFSGKDLKIIANVAEQRGLTIISDEVYRSLVFDGKKHESILSYVNDKKNVVLVDSLSKEFCMTGWRIGYAFGSEEIISNMVKLQENVVACAPLASQHALIEAYSNDFDNESRLQEFQRRRDLVYEGINGIKGLYCEKPKGTFYVFVNIEDTSLTSLEFATKLLERKQVAVVPGITYGNDYDGFVRIALTKDIKILDNAIQKIKEFVEELSIKK